jgi:hypothetical protein
MQSLRDQEEYSGKQKLYVMIFRTGQVLGREDLIFMLEAGLVQDVKTD